jgi:hypothetical protein
MRFAPSYLPVPSADKHLLLAIPGTVFVYFIQVTEFWQLDFPARQLASPPSRPLRYALNVKVATPWEVP